LTRLKKALIRLDADLRAVGARWALVGGFAVILRAESRSTRDLDLVLAVSGEREAESLVLSLRMRGYRDHPKGGMIERKDGRLSTVRLVSPPLDEENIGSEIDLLIACAGVEAEVVAAATPMELMPGVVIPVARVGHLVALKVLAGRLKDLEHIHVLIRAMEADDLQLARETVDLIERRGFNEKPERNLLAELGKLLDEAKSNQDF
jgi:nucleotidyltransferase AbiEii toxin of type IV toxin-antitoxin system